MDDQTPEMLSTDAQHVVDALQRLLDPAQHGQKAQLAAHCGVTPQAVSGWVRTGRISKTKIAKVAEFFSVPVSYLIPSAPTAPLITGDIETLYAFTVPSITTWEDLMRTRPITGVIRFRLADDALGDKLPRGTEVVMAADGSKPEPGQVILVEDAQGHLYVRRYAEGRNGKWQAIAGNPAYPNLDSVEDKLSLIAVIMWVNGKNL